MNFRFLEGRFDSDGSELGGGNGNERSIELISISTKLTELKAQDPTFAVGVLEALRIYASWISCRAEVVALKCL